MKWKPSPLEQIIDLLRFLIHGSWLFVAIAFSAFVVWFAGKSILHLGAYVSKEFFRQGW